MRSEDPVKHFIRDQSRQTVKDHLAERQGYDLGHSYSTRLSSSTLIGGRTTDCQLAGHGVAFEASILSV